MAFQYHYHETAQSFKNPSTFLHFTRFEMMFDNTTTHNFLRLLVKLGAHYMAGGNVSSWTLIG